jgi:hypothetical protein
LAITTLGVCKSSPDFGSREGGRSALENFQSRGRSYIFVSGHWHGGTGIAFRELTKVGAEINECFCPGWEGEATYCLDPEITGRSKGNGGMFHRHHSLTFSSLQRLSAGRATAMLTDRLILTCGSFRDYETTERLIPFYVQGREKDIPERYRSMLGGWGTHAKMPEENGVIVLKDPSDCKHMNCSAYLWAQFLGAPRVSLVHVIRHPYFNYHADYMDQCKEAGSCLRKWARGLCSFMTWGLPRNAASYSIARYEDFLQPEISSSIVALHKSAIGAAPAGVENHSRRLELHAGKVDINSTFGHCKQGTGRVASAACFRMPDVTSGDGRFVRKYAKWVMSAFGYDLLDPKNIMLRPEALYSSSKKSTELNASILHILQKIGGHV